jgi:uncharacterized protein with GYD domain
MKSLIDNPQDRSGMVRSLIEGNGGKLLGAWMAFGENDIVVIAELPDDESMAAVAMAVSSTGAIVNGKSTQLLSMDQAVAAMTKAQAVAQAYSPPS